MSGNDQSRNGSGNDENGNSARSSSIGSDNGDGQEAEEGGPSMAEMITMVVSVSFTLALFAFVVLQALNTPTGVPPQASIVGTQSMADGDVRVTVRLTNPSDIGLQFVTAEVNCTSPPPEIQFQNVPADDYQIGYVKCPSGTSNPEASVAWWIEA